MSVFLGQDHIHTGQFMAVFSGQNKDSKDPSKIEDIIRIDLGARDRHAGIRLATKAFKAGETSEAYRTSGKFGIGQIGKTYMEFLLKDPDVKANYMQLLIRMNPGQITKAATDAVENFTDAIAEVPEPQKKETLMKICKLYGIKPEKNADIKKLKDSITEEMKKVVSTRLNMMHESAKQDTQALIDKVFKKDELSSIRYLHWVISTPSGETRTKFIANNSKLESFLKEIRKKMEENPASNADCQQLLERVHAALYFSEELDEAIRLEALRKINEVRRSPLSQVKVDQAVVKKSLQEVAQEGVVHKAVQQTAQDHKDVITHAVQKFTKGPGN